MFTELEKSVSHPVFLGDSVDSRRPFRQKKSSTVATFLGDSVDSRHYFFA